MIAVTSAVSALPTPTYALTLAFTALIIGGCERGESRNDSTATIRQSSNAAHDSLRARADRDRVAGDSAADLWLIVASDFQCPYCAQWHRETYRVLRDAYVRTGKVRMAYLHFPLEQHQHALPAAVASMCAGAQGKFWPVHDAIFTEQARWAPLPEAKPIFESMASRAGVDLRAYRDCVSARVMEPLITADSDRGVAAGVQSTPTFLITAAKPPARRGQLIRGAAPAAEFRRALDSMLAAGTRR